MSIEYKEEDNNKKLKVNFMVKINGIEIITIKSYEDILIVKEK
jgi:hypothetical protein